ncbi:hypothetical protein GCK32_003878 [Trichostrongylus colubriformis]|uniref:Uncharacterized protein n=1 Tax=Trichostrongylus colubriformis TaxID=6319 RepID=A0AAN8FYU5_TRICO
MNDIEMEDPTESDDYHLSRVIDAHKADVKCITSTSAGVLISGGRDENVRFWTKRGGEFSETLSFPQPKGLAVNSIGYYESTDGWRLFVGRKDGSIAVYGSGSSEPLTVLTQHSSNVCCLYVDEKNHILLSGSWDNNVIVWPIRELGSPEFAALLLNGHKLSVWALAAIESSPGYYLTGSADKTIKLWRDDNEIRTYKGHTDVVRALLVVSVDRFLSAGNDSTICMWHTETGACLATYSSLVDTFIFCLTLVDSNVVSCSEGGHIEVWRQLCVEDQFSLVHNQIVQLPALTAWAVKGLPNGDVACATSDGRIYVLTQEASRKATAAVLTAFDDAVAAKVAKELERKEQQANETVVIKVSLDDGAPNMELRYKKGTDPTLAAEKFIQDYNLPASYLNEITDYITAHVPEAAAAARKKHKLQPTQRVTVDGKEYDYVFDVTVDDGRKLRLPFNMDEDPDEAAQRFVEKHNLPVSFLAKVAGLLRSQTGASVSSSSQPFYDPFTGSGRYIPGQSSEALSPATSADPFTGTGRYVPGNFGDAPAPAGGDPYTGSGGYKPGSISGDLIPNACLPQDKKRPRGELVPMSSYYRFGVEQLSTKAHAKLVELNENQPVLRLSDVQVSAIKQLMSPGNHTIEYDIIAAALDVGLQWAMSDLVPILDAFRVALLHEKLNTFFCDMKGRGEITHQRLCALLLSDAPDAVCILVCRSLANAFIHPCGREMLCHDFQNLLVVVANQLKSSKAALQLAAASTLANWSLLLLNRSETVAELGPREDAIRGIIKVCETIDSFGYLSRDGMIRLLQAIVTFMWGDTSVISVGFQFYLSDYINLPVRDNNLDNRIGGCVCSMSDEESSQIPRMVASDDRPSSSGTSRAAMAEEFSRNLLGSVEKFHLNAKHRQSSVHVVNVLSLMQIGGASGSSKIDYDILRAMIRSKIRKYSPSETFRIRGLATYSCRRLIMPMSHQVVSMDSLSTISVLGLDFSEKIVSTLMVESQPPREDGAVPNAFILVLSNLGRLRFCNIHTGECMHTFQLPIRRFKFKHIHWNKAFSEVWLLGRAVLPGNDNGSERIGPSPSIAVFEIQPPRFKALLQLDKNVFQNIHAAGLEDDVLVTFNSSPHSCTLYSFDEIYRNHCTQVYDPVGEAEHCANIGFNVKLSTRPKQLLDVKGRMDTIRKVDLVAEDEIMVLICYDGKNTIAEMYRLTEEDTRKWHPEIPMYDALFPSSTRMVMLRTLSVRGFHCSRFSLSKMRPTAGLIVIGDEILKGSTMDTNSYFICKKLHQLGVQVKKISSIGDNVDEISDEIRSFSERFDYVFTTGGVGPTHDDKTYIGLARAFNEDLRKSPEIIAAIKRYLPVKKMTNEHESFVEKLSMIPASAQLLWSKQTENGKPSSFPVVKTRNVVTLPGVPRFCEKAFVELKASESLTFRSMTGLRDDQIFPSSLKPMYSKTVYTSKDEVNLANQLAEIASNYEGVVEIGSYPVMANTVKKFECYRERQLAKNPDYVARIDDALVVIRDILDQYPLEQISLSFNGGKDCTVLLHLFRLAVDQSPVQWTDPDWPKVLRVCPILSWSYTDVWMTLRELCIPYCPLYDMGYTSLGGRTTTMKNPLLKVATKDGSERYMPAYKLTNDEAERNGRSFL